MGWEVDSLLREKEGFGNSIHKLIEFGEYFGDVEPEGLTAARRHIGVAEQNERKAVRLP